MPGFWAHVKQKLNASINVKKILRPKVRTAWDLIPGPPLLREIYLRDHIQSGLKKRTNEMNPIASSVIY